MSRWEFFSDKEVKDLDPSFVDLLDRARKISATPYVITSGKRTVLDNDGVGGVKESAHIYGLAVDLRCRDSVTRWKILRGLIAVGFCRIGIYDLHLHVDNDITKPQGVIWFSNES